MIEIRLDEDRLLLRWQEHEMRPRHVSQLAFWGFSKVQGEDLFTSDGSGVLAVLPKLVAYLDRQQLAYTLDERLTAIVDAARKDYSLLGEAVQQSAAFKAGTLRIADAKEFLTFLTDSVPRRLKEHQIKAALHLLTARNGANFSVPGSGKTAVVLSAFARLRQVGEIDSLFVVGPPACFAPWQDEYFATIGVRPQCQVMVGGNIDARRSQYLVNRDTVSDLYLTSFQTLQNDWPHVRTLFQRQGVRFLFVVDEAHYIKQLGGVWAEAVLTVAREATRRCVLTGTPFPRSLSDAFNLFDVLWPTISPISEQDRHRVAYHVQRKEHSAAVDILESAIGPLFYRVRKSDLGLAPQVFHDPVLVQMNTHERLVYDSILDRITAASMTDYFRNHELLIALRRGRMVRLRQCVSNVALLRTAVTEYQENLIGSDISLAHIIEQYGELELPAKIQAAVPLIVQIVGRGEKVVVWSNFVGTLKLLVEHCQIAGCSVGLIYGRTPFEKAGLAEESSREHIIRRFCDPLDAMNVLVANPAACAESVSLHKVCSHAIYYDLSYNCAQYLQSLDRIHRVGGSEDKESHYYILQYKDSIDGDIFANVAAKARNMAEVIDRDYVIYDLDMFAEDEELEAYERLFGHE